MNRYFSKKELANMTNKEIAREAIDATRTYNNKTKLWASIPADGWLEEVHNVYRSSSRSIADINKVVDACKPLKQRPESIPYLAAIIASNANIPEECDYDVMEQALDANPIVCTPASTFNIEIDDEAAIDNINAQYKEMMGQADEYEKSTGDKATADKFREIAKELKSSGTSAISKIKKIYEQLNKREKEKAEKAKKDKSKKDTPFTDEEKIELLKTFTNVFEMNNKAIDATDAARVMSIVNGHYCQKGFKIHKIDGRGIFHNYKDNVYEFIFGTTKGDSVILKVDLNTDRVEFLEISEVVA